MTNFLQKTKKTILTLAILLTISSSVYSQIPWSGTQTFNANENIHDNIILNGDVDIVVAQDVVVFIYGIINGNQSLTKSGPGTLYLANNNDYSGLTKINEGMLVIGAGGTTGSIKSANIINNGILHIDRNEDYIFFSNISGTGKVVKGYFAKLTLTGNNTYTGVTEIADGTLALGETGTIENSESVTFTSVASTSKFDISAGSKKIKSLGYSENTNCEIILGSSTLTIGIEGEENGGGDFRGTISGEGGIIKFGTNPLSLAGNNAYNGTTTISNAHLWLSNLKGNAIVADNKAFLVFSNGPDYTYSGVISGVGHLAKVGTNTLILTGAHTFTGACDFYHGTIVLSTTGSIENSGGGIHLFGEPCGKLDVSSGNKKIKYFETVDENAEVILGTKTLTIECGVFSGKFTGSGDVIKTGPGGFTMNGENKTSGKFSLNGGTVEFSKEWSGNFTQAAGTNLVVKGNAIIGGTCLLMGGKISMDLTAETPSKLIVMGAASAPGKGKTELNIKTNEITDYVLISAASGLNATSFTLGVPESVAKLSTPNGTQLLLTAYQSMLDIASASLSNQITVYPNPTNGQLTIDNGQLTINGVELYDVFGRKVYEDNNSYGLMLLRSYDLTVFPAGIYFLKITTETGIVTKKVIKN